jgi:transposase
MAHAKSITLTDNDRKYLQTLIRQRTMQAQIIDRAKILIYKEQGNANGAIAERLDVHINTVRLCLEKFKAGGIQRALYDDPRSGRPVEITDDAVAWIISIACQRPADLGYAQELWTLKKLHQHIQQHAESSGYSRLATITKPMIQKILKRSDIKPFKIKYYCEKRDPDFEEKMHNGLVVYKQLSLQFNEDEML